jgi:hypothetical protein
MKYTITIDWLKLQCAGTIFPLNNKQTEIGLIALNDSFSLKINNSKHNPGFHLTYNIYHSKIPFAYLYYENNGKYRFEHHNTVIIELENHVFYEDGFSDKLKELINALQIQFIRYSELHIAIDGLDLIKEHNKLVKSTLLKREQKVRVMPEFDEKTKSHKSYTLGSRKADKFITIYPKQIFLHKEYKPYIKEYWEKNELIAKEGQQIDRIELRFKKAKQLRDFDKDFSKLESTSYLASYFKVTGGAYVNFISKKSKRKKSLINWSNFEMTKIEKSTMVKPSGVKRAHFTTIKTLIQEYKFSMDESYVETAVNLSDRKGINNEVAKMVIRWLNEC